MRIPRAIAVALGLRQATNLLPDSYCTPECRESFPCRVTNHSADSLVAATCRADFAVFDTAISCVANSSFINNCGNCQTCVLTYNLENGETAQAVQIQDGVAKILNFCENTTVSTIIQAYQSQANRVSSWAQALATATGTSSSRLSSMSITTIPTATGTAVSASSATATGNQTAINNAYLTPTPSTTPSNSSNPPLSHSWVVGPVAGSVLGMSTVFVVIFFTRRKQRRETLTVEDGPKPFHDTPDSPSTRSSSAAGDDAAQLHSEAVEVRELETTEIYELADNEPVGSELNTPMAARPRVRLNGDGTTEEDEEGEEEQWPMRTPLPLSPLPALFAASELRDQRMGRSESLRHETYYHP